MQNILVCGVGGQGVLLATDLLADVALKNGLDVKKAEVHGMAQRGGSVVSHVRFGPKVYSPLISKGEANILLSFEMLETLRYLEFLSKDTKVILNTQKIMPSSTVLGKDKYPDNVTDILKEHVNEVVSVDAVSEAIKIGNVKTVNVFMLGILSKFLPFSEESWLEVILSSVPPKVKDINKVAFLSGKNFNL